ncbi:helix-turn-helix domain-containing protein [Streptomyces niveus]|uniref:helix-turn-helix domain-containing protein n=1 Tax=Streptomyces niveus TaxID=193462 RepID=UPI0038688954
MARGLADFDPQALYEFRSAKIQVGGGVGPLTAEMLADRVGTTKAQILAYENGHRTPDPQRIRALAEALHVRPQDLMRREGRRNWEVADIRRASGLRAGDVVKELCISPKSYRRFEQQGIVPVRRPRFLDDVAGVLGITYAALQAAIDNIPAVMERRDSSAEIVRELARRYVHNPGVWTGPDLEDPGVLQLAALYGRPPQRIRRILTRALGELRLLSVRMRREKIIADFDPDLARQQRAISAIERWEEAYSMEVARIPVRLEGFHRSAQPSDAWQALVDLSDADTRPDGPWVFTSLLGRPETLAQLPPFLVKQHEFDGVPAAQLTASGHVHVRNFQEMYAALYPGLRRPRARASRRSAGTARSAREGGFTLRGRPERFVIPPHALDQLILSSEKGPTDIRVAPNLRLSIGGGGRSTAVSEATFEPLPLWAPPEDRDG